MPNPELEEVAAFDPFAILGGLMTLLAYALCIAVKPIYVEVINLNLFGAVFCGSFGAILNLWVFLRKGKYHQDSGRLAAFSLFLGLPFSCCGWGALTH